MEKLTQAIVEVWISETTGRFNSATICEELSIAPDLKDYLRTILKRCRDKNFITPIPGRHGWYRYVDTKAVRMDLVNANPQNTLNIKWPFGIERYVRLYKGNLVILYGSKDAGKTAVAINLLKLNLGSFRLRYLNSDMGDAELRSRLEKFDDVTIEQWQHYVDFIERSYGFADLIDPNAINIVDFLEVHKDFFAIGEPIKEMLDKIEEGLLVVILQKNPGAELPIGKMRSLDKAKLAINLDPGKITLAVAKNWQDGITSSPKGKSWTYKLIGGALIVNPIEAT